MIEPYYQDDAVTLYDRSFGEVLPSLAPESVRLVFTDPPYDRAAIALYGGVAREASRLLSPGGALVCYAGHYAVPDILEQMRPHLRFWWLIALTQPGDSARLPGLNVIVTWKPLLLFVKEKRGWPGFVRDSYVSPRPDKRHHAWGQSIEPAREIIAQLTDPGDVVLDPFAGGGTTLRAAKDLGRRAIGCEIDPTHCATVAGRMAQQILTLEAA